MYINEIECNNMIYSIDMIRLKTYLSYSIFTEIEFRFKTIWKDYIKKNYTTPKIQQFFYNYIIDIGNNNSFWFGFCHNNERRSFSEETKYNFTIEFNPNKVKDNKILFYLLSLSGEWFIKSFDLAIDLKINILDIIVDLGLKRSSKIFNNGYDDKTIYLGKGDRRVKIYNKKIESNLDIVGDLTRVEISRIYDDFNISDIRKFDFENCFPNLFLNKYLYSFKDYEDKTLLAVLYAVQNNFPIKDLTRVYRKKIKNLLEGGYAINFSNTVATKVVIQTILYYFIKNIKVKWN